MLTTFLLIVCTGPAIRTYYTTTVHYIETKQNEKMKMLRNGLLSSEHSMYRCQ